MVLTVEEGSSEKEAVVELNGVVSSSDVLKACLELVVLVAAMVGGEGVVVSSSTECCKLVRDLASELLADDEVCTELGELSYNVAYPLAPVVAVSVINVSSSYCNAVVVVRAAAFVRNVLMEAPSEDVTSLKNLLAVLGDKDVMSS